MEGIAPRLSAAMARITGGSVLSVESLQRLTGGANMESSAFEYAGHSYVLRRAPNAEMMAGRTYGHDVEAALVRAAYAAGVKAPEIIGEIAPVDQLGTGYIMRRVIAEVNPAKILANPPPSLLSDLARELAKIHGIALNTLPSLPMPDVATLVDDMKIRFTAYGGDRPIFALAFKWLEDHLPAPSAPVFLHGDYRMGNVMVDEQGLSAVLDWELAHIGDRHQDLAFGCINSWRFGHIDRPAFGCGQIEDLFAAYEAENGVKPDPIRFRFWLIYSTLWWGMCCLQMAEIWRSGMDKSLERVVIGRRTSETEVDLLMLLEEDAPETQRLAITLSAPAEPRRMGEPSTTEMLEAITNWIVTEFKPKVEGRDKFMAAVAINALGMLTRQAETSMSVHDKALSDDILAGRKTLASTGLLAKLKRAALDKLAVDQPKYSALAKAHTLWGAQ